MASGIWKGEANHGKPPIGRTLLGHWPDWRDRAHEELVAVIGSARLGSALLALAAELAQASEIFGFSLRGEERPQLIASHGSRGSSWRRASLYLDRFHKLDPLHRLIRDSAVDHAVMMRSFRSRDIEDPVYRQRCFEHPGLVEKLACFRRYGTRIHVLTFYRCDTEFDNAQDLLELARLALPVLRRHGELLGSELGLTLAERLEQRLAMRFPLLTQRERQVCARTLAGMTAEAISLDLEIGRTSVLTYRRRAYERYNISAAGQLVGSLLT